jgi:hypothetical protein
MLDAQRPAGKRGNGSNAAVFYRLPYNFSAYQTGGAGNEDVHTLNVMQKKGPLYPVVPALQASDYVDRQFG